MSSKGKKAIITILAISVVAVAMPKISFNFKLNKREKAYFDNLDKNAEIYAEKRREVEKEAESDIDGMSIYDKIQMGLQPQSGSDSDNDGLTDKEEIEKYGTDPLAASTSGDLYSDGYKVANNMELNKVYDNENVVYNYNECPEITLNATICEDTNAEVKDITEFVKSQRFNWTDVHNVIKDYSICSYAGEVSIDISAFECDLEDLEIYIASDMYGGDMKKAETEKNDGKIITTLDNENRDCQRNLIITEKKSVKKVLFNAANNDSSEEENNNGKGQALCTSVLLLNWLYLKNVDIIYVSSGDVQKDKEMLQEMVEAYNYSISVPGRADVNDCKQVSAEVFNKKLKTLRTFFPADEIVPYDNDDVLGLEYYTYEDVSNTSNPEEAEEAKFVMQREILPFPNFSSRISTGGNCAGISYLTAKLHNSGSAPNSGSYDIPKYLVGKEYHIDWDISIDEDNETLTDRYLYDYKSSDWLNDKKDKDGLVSVNLSLGEQEFVKMIGCYWAESCAKCTDALSTKNHTITPELIERMTALLDNNKILCIGFNFFDKEAKEVENKYNGHMVNVYGYEYVNNDSNSVIFHIYDCNLPNNRNGGIRVYNTRLYVNILGNGTIKYYYNPTESETNYVTSEIDDEEYQIFQVMDENMNILNSDL